MDLSAAFNTFDHSILTSVLSNNFEIKDTALKWFNSYLQPRSFKVAVNWKYSEEKQPIYGVLKGSCLGPNLFNLYCSMLNNVVPSDWHLSGFVDDHSVRKEFKANDRSAELQTKNDVEEYMVDVKSWMDQVRLKLNPSKTEFIYFESRTQLSKCVVTQLNVNGELMERATLIKYFRAWLDVQLSFQEHTTKKCQTAIINYLHIRNIHHLLTDSACETLLLCLCVSHLDYANTLLYGLPETTIDKFQRIQNMCAHLILGRSKRSSITQCFKDLHWLPICQRIEFKIFTLTYKYLNKQAPEYLQNLLLELPSWRSGLRSQLTHEKLLIPFMKRKTFTQRSFSVAIPTLWNKLPLKIKQASTLNQFKSLLKTFISKFLTMSSQIILWT